MKFARVPLKTDPYLVYIGRDVLENAGKLVAGHFKGNRIALITHSKLFALRGIPLFHVPTTVVAQVDSSVGGKTRYQSSIREELNGRILSAARRPVRCAGTLHIAAKGICIRACRSGEVRNDL